MTDHYDTLDVARDATADEIRVAFRRAASAAHPDRDGGNAERMAAVNDAWAVLGDAEKRAEYDATGRCDGADRFELEARERLIGVFAELLEAPDHVHDLVGDARRAVEAAISSLAAELAQVAGRAKRLERQRKRIVRKDGGENLFTSLIDQRLAKLATLPLHLEHGQRVMRRVLELLAAYENGDLRLPVLQARPQPMTAWGFMR